MLTLEECANDLGEAMQKYISQFSGRELTFQLPAGRFVWNKVVEVSGFKLRIRSAACQHRAINKDDNNDNDTARCGATTIIMNERAVTYPTRKKGEAYFDTTLNRRILVLGGSKLTLEGLTIKETIHLKNNTVQAESDAKANSDADADAAKRVYEHGIVTLRENALCEIRDCRIEFSEKVFVNAHSSGVMHVNFGHTRFVGLGSDQQESVSPNPPSAAQKFPVAATRGQSWSGGRCYISRTDAILEGTAVWRDAAEKVDPEGYPNFSVEYLS